MSDPYPEEMKAKELNSLQKLLSKQGENWEEIKFEDNNPMSAPTQKPNGDNVDSQIYTDQQQKKPDINSNSEQIPALVPTEENQKSIHLENVDTIKQKPQQSNQPQQEPAHQQTQNILQPTFVQRSEQNFSEIAPINLNIDLKKFAAIFAVAQQQNQLLTSQNPVTPIQYQPPLQSQYQTQKISQYHPQPQENTPSSQTQSSQPPSQHSQPNNQQLDKQTSQSDKQTSQSDQQTSQPDKQTSQQISQSDKQTSQPDQQTSQLDKQTSQSDQQTSQLDKQNETQPHRDASPQQETLPSSETQENSNLSQKSSPSSIAASSINSEQTTTVLNPLHLKQNPNETKKAEMNEHISEYNHLENKIISGKQKSKISKQTYKQTKVIPLLCFTEMETTSSIEILKQRMQLLKEGGLSQQHSNYLLTTALPRIIKSITKRR